MKGFLHGIAFLSTAAAVPAAGWAQEPAGYDCRFVRVPARDGVRLNTSICAPRGAHEPVPFLLTRTPYGIAGDTLVRSDYRFLARDGYIFVFQDIRGRYGSEGKFIMQRPPRPTGDTTAVDESTDT